MTIETEIDVLVENTVLQFDDQRIRSVILNLLMNAIKFSRSGGKITVAAKLLGGEEDQLMISVADTGIGISDEVKASLFTLFRSIPRLNNQLDFGSMKK